MEFIESAYQQTRARLLHTLFSATTWPGLHGLLAYLAFAIALLSDIAFNRARWCTRAINGISSSLGSAFEVLPC